MIPNITRGENFLGVTEYLVGPGRTNEHTNPQVVAGDMDTYLTFAGHPLQRADAVAIAKALDESRLLMGTRVTVLRTVAASDSGVLEKEREDAHVWHCSLSLAAAEGEIGNAKWNEIANDFVDAMGFTEASGKAECKWVAVHHGQSKMGNDHIHIAVSLVRTDGTKASVHNDFSKAQKVCRELEVKHGLAITGDRANELGTRGVNPAAQGAAIARERDRLKSELGLSHEEATAAARGAQPDAVRLARTLRAAAAASADEGEFVRRARRSGLLIRPRFAAGRNDVVEGYSVALRPQGPAKPIWHGGGKVARDLTLPRLRADWDDTPELSLVAVDEWRAVASNMPAQHPGREVTKPSPELWLDYSRDLSAMRSQMAEVPLDDRGTWAAFAREQAGVFASWSQLTESGEEQPLRELSAELAKTAQLRAHDARLKPARVSSTTRGLGAMLMASGLPANSVAAQLMMLQQLQGAATAIVEMIAARGDLVRSEQMRDAVKAKLDMVRTNIQAPAGAQDGGQWTAVDERKPADAGALGRRTPLAIDPKRSSSRTIDNQPRENDHGIER